MKNYSIQEEKDNEKDKKEEGFGKNHK